MDIRAHVIALNTERAKAAKALEAHVDECHAAHPGQPMSGEEKEKLDRINADIDRLEDEVRSFVSMETREQESAQVREAHASIFGAPAPTPDKLSEVERFAAWARGDGPNNYHVDLSAGQRLVDAVRAGADTRDIRAGLLSDTGSVGSTVPTDLSSTLYAYRRQPCSR